MDAVRFIKERTRMCESFGDRCNGCPASNGGCAVGQESTLDATDQVAMVEDWSAAHPRKTRQSMFLEQYPEAVLDERGAVWICPRYFSASYRDSEMLCSHPERVCADCMREFWMQEVE